MLTNTAATLYNKYRNPDTRIEEWRRTELNAVHWENNKAANVRASGIAAADSTTVIIWFTVDTGGKRYVEPKQYAALPPDKVDGYWTLTEMDDRLIKGIVPGDLVVDSMKPFDRRYDNLITVKSVDTMDCGPQSMQHWEVSGA